MRTIFGEEIEAADRALVEYMAELKGPASHYELIRYQLGLVDEHMQPVAGMRLERGKRLRPVLCMLIGRAIGVDPRVARTLMLASELLHAASLVHDDIEDQEPLRWGRPTLWSLVGTAQAVNAGDALLAMSYDVVIRLRGLDVPLDLVLRATEAYIRATLRMAEGQHLDLHHQHRLDLGVPAYLDVINRKTGAALECFCGATAVLGGSNPELEDAYRRFGSAFGVLYQVADDIRGIFSELDETGKQPRRDIVLRKTTLPLLMAVERGPAPLREFLLQDGSSKPKFTDGEAIDIVEQLTAAGIDKMCKDVAIEYRDAALDALAATKMRQEERKMLETIVGMCATAFGGVRTEEKQ